MNFVLSSVIILFLGIPSLIRISIRLMTCKVLHDTDVRVADDMNVRCFSAVHTLFALGLGLPALILYGLLIPTVCFLRLRKLNKQDKLWSADSDHMYIFLYCGFTNKAYYWEFVVLARKVTVNIVLLVSDKATVQGLLFLFVFSSCSLLHKCASSYTSCTLVSTPRASLIPMPVFFHSQIVLCSQIAL